MKAQNDKNPPSLQAQCENSHEFKSKFKGIINFCLKIKRLQTPVSIKTGANSFQKKELLKEILSQGQGENPCLKCFFRTSSKGFLCVFSHNDEKDGVSCVKTEPFKARFCGFFAFLKKAQNDKFLVILSLWRSIHEFKACLKILWIFR